MVYTTGLYISDRELSEIRPIRGVTSSELRVK